MSSRLRAIRQDEWKEGETYTANAELFSSDYTPSDVGTLIFLVKTGVASKFRVKLKNSSGTLLDTLPMKDNANLTASAAVGLSIPVDPTYKYNFTLSASAVASSSKGVTFQVFFQLDQ